MAFDQTDPADLAELKTEWENPRYAAVLGETQNLLDLTNLPENNPGGESINRPTEELDISDIAAVIDTAEYAALAEYNKSWVRMFISRPDDVKLKPYQTKFTQIFPPGTATLTGALALRAKLAGRAEVLWGVNTKITRSDFHEVRSLP